jgi:uncharacterized membrane protein
VGRAGRRAFEDALEIASADDAPAFRPSEYVGEEPPTLVVRSRRAGAIQAIDDRGLVHFARANDCVVVLPRAIGDFVAEGAVLLEVYGGAGLSAADEKRLRSKVALGVERTIEQDPTFAIRVMVDVAIRALSPAVNDPTTAVQVLDHLGDTLRLIGSTPPDAGLGRVRESRPAVVVRTRRWEDIVSLALTEIREYGSSSIQVMRRLRAMLEELAEGVLPERRMAVEDELARLDATLDLRWGESVDADRARTADRQGIGGPSAEVSPG